MKLFRAFMRIQNKKKAYETTKNYTANNQKGQFISG